MAPSFSETKATSSLIYDLRAAIPLVIAALATLAWTRSFRFFSSGAVANYALSPSGWRDILSARLAAG